MATQKRRKRRGKPGDLAALKKELWHAIVTAADLLDHDDAQVRLRAVHAVSQSSAAYRGVYETETLEQRLTELEARVAQGDDK